GERPDDDALAGGLLDEAEPIQDAERLAHGVAADPEHAREVRLGGQRRVRRQLARLDVAAGLLRLAAGHALLGGGASGGGGGGGGGSGELWTNPPACRGRQGGWGALNPVLPGGRFG